jgi:cytochrome o ubiquinol oxidase subunit 2
LSAGFPALAASVLLSGCSNVPLLQPGGPIGESERFVIGTAFTLMLIVVIPVIIMVIWFPRKYRASDTQHDYDPKCSDSARIDLVVWLIPAIIVLALGALTWHESHRLDPSRPIETAIKPLKVEVVSLDWKWLFIYPDLNLATVNRLVIPVGVPLSFQLTSDRAGTYTGQNQQFSGAGFADMHFKVHAVTPQQFAAWVQHTRQAPRQLDLARYQVLRTPSADNPPQSFSGVRHELFESILNRYRQPPSKLSGTGTTGKGN